MKKDRRNQFLYWWPVVARLFGIIIVVVEMAITAVSPEPADPAILAFAGALIVVPFIFGEQERRNGK